MKYAIASLILLIVVFVLIITYLKNASNKHTNTQKANVIKEAEENKNPAIQVTLVEYKKYQLNIYNSKINELLTLRKSKDKKIKILNQSKCIGIISAKDIKNLELIQKKPEYFEGRIIAFEKQSNLLNKVIVEIQAKLNCSKKIYKINKVYLNSIISIHSLFIKDQIIETNYGPSTIIEVLDDHLLVDVPSLGTREIYDIKEIEI